MCGCWMDVGDGNGGCWLVWDGMVCGWMTIHSRRAEALCSVILPLQGIDNPEGVL